MKQDRSKKISPGDTFNRLTFIKLSRITKRPYKSGFYTTHWGEFQCSCGEFTERSIYQVIEGSTKSCGCLTFNRNWEEKETIRINQIASQYRSNCAKKQKDGYSTKWMLTKDQVGLIIKSNCYYCGSPPSNKVKYKHDCKDYFEYTGIDKIDPNGDYEISNVVPSCWQCNCAKRANSQEDFLRWIKQLYNHQFNQLSYC